MKNLLEKLRVEDWVAVWVSVPLLLLSALVPRSLPAVPATLVGSVAWYNDAFRDDVMGGRDVCLLPMSKVVPAFMPALAKEKTGQNIEFGGQRYSVYGSGVEAGDGLFVAYFVNNTTLKRQAGEYLATRPAVMLIAVDTYDEILKEMKESDRARVAGEIDLALEQFIGATTGFSAAHQRFAVYRCGGRAPYAGDR